MSLGLWAQSTMRGHSVDFSVGAGWTDLTYSVTGGRNTGTWGGQAYLGYNYFFSRYFGLGIGTEVARYGSALEMNREFVWANVHDGDGRTYDHHTTVTNWQEEQSGYYFNIPMSVQVAVPFEKVSFTAAWGVKYSLKLADGFYRAHGTVNHQGYYGNEVKDFYQEDLNINALQKEECRLDIENHWGMFLNVGAMFPLTRNLFFITQVYSNASIRPMVYLTKTQTAGFYAGRQDLPYDFYFMKPYSSMLTTEETAGITSSNVEGDGYTSGVSSSAAYNYQVGLQIGIRYVFPSYIRTQGCNCPDDKW